LLGDLDFVQAINARSVHERLNEHLRNLANRAVKHGGLA
jgi:hypothetical protein